MNARRGADYAHKIPFAPHPLQPRRSLSHSHTPSLFLSGRVSLSLCLHLASPVCHPSLWAATSPARQRDAVFSGER